MLEKNPNYDLMETSIQNRNARGGTEILQDKLYSALPRDLLQQCQIYLSRVESPLKKDKIRIFWAHDLAGDAMATKALGAGKWRKFHRIVFVSNWQMQTYIQKFEIAWSKCVVIHNSIDAIERHQKPNDGRINIAYYANPIKGLALLVPVFDELSKIYANIRLNVYSSFDLYGWDERDKQLMPLFDMCVAHPKINYHKSVSNREIREILKQQHIFAYPSVWQETSCLALIEAMSAALLCVHPNYGALPETAANWTVQYQYHEDPISHAHRFYEVLDRILSHYDFAAVQPKLKAQKIYADTFYDWNEKKEEWRYLLMSLQNEPRDLL